eukprot:CAMPEP_0116867098 /NCGR_PEP_ID=MMETSP0418-20121206/26422_1 /TAXON_ID=1158023 /ORGANISM="Astrosyne radiata, Strain 13vi08-1A" /LENGTH=403 /DNA_ID=CAMNT_0004502859 /DNA_START=31 /DNA_END=1242 /DNA_ORIENTATION=-
MTTTRMDFTLHHSSSSMISSSTPTTSFTTLSNHLSKSFLLWSERNYSATALPCRQTLLLDKSLAGRIHVHGRFVTTWSPNSGNIGTHVEALFGMDLHSIAVWHGRIVDYEQCKHAYSKCWQELLIDARFSTLNLAKMLLTRLLRGIAPKQSQDDDHDSYDDDGYDDPHEDDNDHDDDDDAKKNKVPDDNQETPAQLQALQQQNAFTMLPTEDTLESQIMGSAKYDPVGICAKALATKFAQMFGRRAFPVLPQDVDVVRRNLGHRIAVRVPARVLRVLRRGGYFDWQKTMQEIWFTDHVRPSEGEEEEELVKRALQCLTDAGCAYAFLPNHVLWVNFCDVTSGGRITDPNPLQNNNACRFHETMQQFYVHDAFVNAKPKFLAFLLAQAHSDPMMMHQYIQTQLS